jgi:hypothetical protein
MTIASGADNGETAEDVADFGMGSRAPFAQIPDWIILADISNTAKVLYCHVAMHMNFQRGDRAVWPSRATLARRMGYSRPDKVDPFIRELVKIGAMKKVAQQRADGGNANNRYLINAMPPEGYPGHASLTEAYQHDRARYADTTPAPKRGPGSEQGKQAKPQVTPRPRNGGHPRPRDEGHPWPRDEGPNKKKFNQTKNNPPSGPPSHSGTAPADAQNGGEELREDKDPLIAAALALRPGWTAGQIRSALALDAVQARPANLRGPALLALAADVDTVHPHRLAVDGPWWRAAAEVATKPSAPALPPRCDDPRHDPAVPSDRYLYDADDFGAGTACPRCHPRHVAAG